MYRSVKTVAGVRNARTVRRRSPPLPWLYDLFDDRRRSANDKTTIRYARYLSFPRSENRPYDEIRDATGNFPRREGGLVVVARSRFSLK